MAVITASPNNFKKLLDIQEKSKEHIETIRTIIEAGGGIGTMRAADAIEKVAKVQEETLRESKEQTKLAKEQEKLAKISSENAKKVAELAKGVQTFESLADKFGNTVESIKKPFMSLSGFKETMFKKMNVGGVLNKKIAREQFVQQQKMMGSGKSDKELRQDFNVRNKEAVKMKKNEQQIAEFQATTGLSEAQMKETPRGAELLSQREDIASRMAPTDVRTAGDTIVKPAKALPLTGKKEEAKMEGAKERKKDAKEQEQHTKLLKDVEKNQKLQIKMAKESADNSGGGGGFLAGLFGGVTGGMAGVSKEAGIMEKAGNGFEKGMKGVAKGIGALASPTTLVGLAAVTLAVMGMGKGLEYATPALKVIGETISDVAGTIGTTVVDGLGEVSNIVTSVGDSMVAVIDSISGAIGDTFDGMVTSVERLNEIGGANLLATGAGLLAVAGGFTALGAGQAVGGVGNLVGGLMEAITPGETPIEKMEKLAAMGKDLESAGIGVEKLAGGLSQFKGIDSDAVKAIASLPTEKLAAMGKAFADSGFVVANGSAANAGMAMAGGSGGGNSTIVNTPVNSSQHKHVQVQLPHRNTDSSYQRYIDSQMMDVSA